MASFRKAQSVGLTYQISLSGRELLPRLARQYQVHRETRPAETWTYYDSFDWRLYQRQLTLRSRPEGRIFRWQLRNLQGELVKRFKTHDSPRFAWDFPRGSVRLQLQKVLWVRSLLPRVEISSNSEMLRVLDKRRKTVCRLRWTRSRARLPEGAVSQVLPLRLRVEAVRGYSTIRKRLVDFLESELALERAPGLPLEEALEAVGVKPADYSGKIRISLDPELRSDRATREVLLSLLQTIQANREGVIQDLDSEFLHDFRVAVRRTRAALGQIKQVFPKRSVKRFRREFSWLGKLTGPVRDLDVYLLQIPEYQASLPAHVRADLAPLAEYLNAQRDAARGRLLRGLGSHRYQQLIRGWEAFLKGPVPRKTTLANAARPIGTVASERIARVYEKVVDKGSQIDPQSAPGKLHRLRLSCKRLRYLIEFFRSLYPAREMDTLIRELKKLQDNLGDYNDYVVQQETLRGIAARATAGRQLPAPTLMCIGRLVERLEAGQALERERFMGRFSRFSSRKNARIFEKLFRIDQWGGGSN